MSDLVERMARAIWNAPQDKTAQGNAYALKMRLSWDEAQRAAKAALDASGLTGGCPADDALNAELSERDKEVERLRAALHGIAVALPLGPRDSVSTWHSLADACQRTARAALPTPSRGGHDAG